MRVWEYAVQQRVVEVRALGEIVSLRDQRVRFEVTARVCLGLG
jgi:hypothetical protein